MARELRQSEQRAVDAGRRHFQGVVAGDGVFDIEVRDGVISVDAARNVYGVAVNPQTLGLDEQETARLRGARM